MGRNSTRFSIIRNFLFTPRSKQFLIFLFFVCISAAFWLMITLNESYEREYSIPVRLHNVPKAIVITGAEEDTLKVTLRDKGIFLIAYEFGNLKSPILMDFAIYAKTTSQGTITSSDLTKRIRQRLYNSTQITSLKPDHWTFSYARGLNKSVPVRLSGNRLTVSGHYLSHVEFSPEQAEVYAPQSLLDSIVAAYIEQPDVELSADTISCIVSIRHIEGAKFVPSQVQLTIYPDVLTETFIEVQVRPVNVPEGKTLRLFPSRTKIHFVASAGDVRDIRPEDFVVEADYESVLQHPEEKCTLSIAKVPQGARNARLETPLVDYLIETE